MKTTLVIPFKVPSNNGTKGLLRMHYRQKTHLRNVMTLLFKQQTKNKHLGKVKVHFCHYHRGSAIKDYGNLVSTEKIPMDAVKDAGIIVDDSMAVIGQPTFEQVRVTDAKHVKTVITIEDV
jgi:hypothetical protein